jgi:Tol biopolymer transport system component
MLSHIRAFFDFDGGIMKKLAILGSLLAMVAAGRLAAAPPVPIPPSWELRQIATNGVECAFSYVDTSISPSDLYINVGGNRLGPFKDISDLGWSPDGAAIGFCAGDGKSTTVYVDGRERGGFSEIWHFQWAPRGGSLAVVGKRENKEVLDLGSGSVELYDFKGGPLDPGTGFRDAQWSPDGSSFYYVFATCYEDYSLWRNTERLLSLPNISQFALSPDGSTIAYTTGKKLVRGDRETDSGTSPIHQIAWSPDSKKLAFIKGTQGNRADAFELWVDSQKTLSVQATRANGLSWAPNGKELAFEYIDAAKDRYLVYNGKKLGPFVDDHLIETYWWSADGKHFAYPVRKKGAGKKWVLLMDGSELGPFSSKPLLPESPWSADGSRSAFSVPGSQEGSGIYVDGKLIVSGESLSDLAWAEGRSALSFTRTEGGVSYSRIWMDGVELPGALFKDKVLALVDGALTIK